MYRYAKFFVLFVAALAIMAGCTVPVPYPAPAQPAAGEVYAAESADGRSIQYVQVADSVAQAPSAPLTLQWSNPLPAAPVNGQAQFLACPEPLESWNPIRQMMILVEWEYLDGQCKLSSETPVWVGQIPPGFRALSAQGVYMPCQPAGMHSGLSLRADDPAKVVVPAGDPKALNAFTGYVPAACPMAAMPDPRPQSQTAPAATERQAQVVMPDGYAIEANGAETGFSCPVVSGIQSTPIEGGCLWKATPAKNFSVPAGWLANNNTGQHPAGSNLGSQSQVSLYPAK